jgi:CBS-domain-containing membrane protein
MKQTQLFRHLGIEFNPVSHTERWISMLGGFLVILLILVISRLYISTADAVLLIPSMGASAVLLFAVPHGALGQPWNVFGGHLLSAVIGVACARLIPDLALAAAASVGLAIAVMHYLRCIHPPGGATALVAVIGGESIHTLGYQYVLTPVLLNVIVMLVVAVAFNFPFHWRRYPATLGYKHTGPEADAGPYGPIEHGDLVYALSEIDSFIDVTEEDLLKIYRLATRHQHPDPHQAPLPGAAGKR